MSAAEMEQYKPAAPPARVAMVQTELNMLAGELSQETTSPESMYYGWMKNSEETVRVTFHPIEANFPETFHHCQSIVS